MDGTTWEYEGKIWKRCLGCGKPMIADLIKCPKCGFVDGQQKLASVPIAVEKRIDPGAVYGRAIDTISEKLAMSTAEIKKAAIENPGFANNLNSMFQEMCREERKAA